LQRDERARYARNRFLKKCGAKISTIASLRHRAVRPPMRGVGHQVSVPNAHGVIAMSPACRIVEWLTGGQAHEDVIVQNAQKPVQERADRSAIAYAWGVLQCAKFRRNAEFRFACAK